MGKAKGKGYVELSCEATLPEDAPEVQFRIGVGKEKETSKTETRGTVSHNFHQQKIGRLPKDQAEWNFESAVDRSVSRDTGCGDPFRPEPHSSDASTHPSPCCSPQSREQNRSGAVCRGHWCPGFAGLENALLPSAFPH